MARMLKVGRGILVRQRESRGRRVQVGARVPAELARQLRVFAVRNDVLIADVLEGCIRAVVGGRRAA